MNKIKKRKCSILVILVYVISVQSILAQQKQKDHIVTKPTLPQKNVPVIQGSEKKDSPVSQIQNTMFLLGGGVSKPLGTEATMLDTSYSLRFMIKKDNIDNTIFGITFDLSYFRLKDNTYSDSFIEYITINPFATMTWSLYRNVWFVQGKTGPGLTLLHSKINNKSESDIAMTLSGGGGMYGIIKQHYVFGFEVLYHYYFQIHASSAIDGYVYIGYML